MTGHTRASAGTTPRDIICGNPKSIGEQSSCKKQSCCNFLCIKEVKIRIWRHSSRARGNTEKPTLLPANSLLKKRRRNSEEKKTNIQSCSLAQINNNSCEISVFTVTSEKMAELGAIRTAGGCHSNCRKTE